MASDLPNYDTTTGLPLYNPTTNLPIYGLECSPCTDCSGTQPSATVSTFGCTPASTVDGTYTYQGFTSGDPCVWHWQSAAGDDLYVRLSATATVTEIYGNDGEYFYDSSGPTVLSCISGVLTGGTFTYRQPSDGCTAAVTLG